MVGSRIPAEPPIRAILAQVAILEAERLSTASHVRVLIERALTIVGMDEFDERTRHQLLAGETKSALPRRAQAFEVSVEIEHAQHVDREIKKALFQVGGARLAWLSDCHHRIDDFATASVAHAPGSARIPPRMSRSACVAPAESRPSSRRPIPAAAESAARSVAE